MVISKFFLFLLVFCLNIKNNNTKNEYKYRHFLESKSFISFEALSDKIIFLKMRKKFDGFVGKDKINEENYYREFLSGVFLREVRVKMEPFSWKNKILGRKI